MNCRVVIFTDLDGTLLDHETYSYSAARQALEYLRAKNLPLILTSSKTVPEILHLQKSMALESPAIAENGAVILLPRKMNITLPPLEPWKIESYNEEYQVAIPELDRKYICEQLEQIRNKDSYDYRYFDEMDGSEIAGLTGLPLPLAQDAKERLGSQPLYWPEAGEELKPFRESLALLGLGLQEGGRFYHVLGDYNKARALRLVSSMYGPGENITLALGDGPNDFEMLSAAEYPVWIPNPATSFTPPEIEGLQIAPYPGPRGWNQSVLEIVKSLEERD